MTKTSKDNDQKFFREIERKFSQLRGGPLLISPKDWALMVEWRNQGIPAVVIIEALEKGFENASFRGTSRKSISSLHYFRRIVEEHWQSFQKRKIGKPEKDRPEHSVHKIKEYLKELSRSLEERSHALSSSTAISRILRRASREVRSLMEKNLETPDDLEYLEEKLSIIDDTVGQRIFEEANSDTVDALLRKAEYELSTMGHHMQEEHYKDIKTRYLLKKLREKYGIPRVSLYFQ